MPLLCLWALGMEEITPVLLVEPTPIAIPAQGSMTVLDPIPALCPAAPLPLLLLVLLLLPLVSPTDVLCQPGTLALTFS